MAEIRVERKRTSSIWPWVVALVALALLVWLIAALRSDDRDDVVGPSSSAARIEATPAMAPAPRRVVGTMPAVLHVPPSLDLLLDFPSA